jgi:hypothetical protein
MKRSLASTAGILPAHLGKFQFGGALTEIP